MADYQTDADSISERGCHGLPLSQTWNSVRVCLIASFRTDQAEFGKAWRAPINVLIPLAEADASTGLESSFVQGCKNQEARRQKTGWQWYQRMQLNGNKMTCPGGVRRNATSMHNLNEDGKGRRPWWFNEQKSKKPQFSCTSKSGTVARRGQKYKSIRITGTSTLSVNAEDEEMTQMVTFQGQEGIRCKLNRKKKRMRSFFKIKHAAWGLNV